MTITPPLTRPSERLLPGWRVAVLAYRATRQAGHDHHTAHDAAVVAPREILPDLPGQRTACSNL